VRVYAIVDDSLSLTSRLGDPRVLVRREDAERFIEEVRGDDPDLCELPADRGAGARGARAELTPGSPLACLVKAPSVLDAYAPVLL
jgi:hypothetical protein